MTQSYSLQSEDQWTVNSCREVSEDGGQHNTACPTPVSKSSCPPFSTVLSHYVPHIASVRTMLVLGIGGRVLVAGELQGWPLWEEVSSSATDPLQDTAETIKAGGISRKTYKRKCQQKMPSRESRKETAGGTPRSEKEQLHGSANVHGCPRSTHTGADGYA